VRKQFPVNRIDHAKTSYEKSGGCNLPTYPKTVPNLIVRLENDSQADPPDKYGHLKDALHWTPNLGAPGFATPAWMEAFNSFAVPRMFASFARGELTAEDAARGVESEVRRIAEKWKGA
jgi:multiple sugar transport system substrate-binding protein